MEAAVFDMDGTLVDSMGFWEGLAKNYLISQGIVPREDLNKTIEPLTVMESISYMKEEYKIEKSCLQIKDELDELLFSYYRKDVKLKPFAVEIIQSLKNKNIKLAIASVTDEELIYSVLNRYGIYQYFEFIQTCGNVNLSKDNEEFYRLLSKRLGTRPSYIFLFEDSFYSMKAAKRAGLKVVGVEDCYAKEDLEEIIEVSDIYFKSFASLIPFLK